MIFIIAPQAVAYHKVGLIVASAEVAEAEIHIACGAADAGEALYSCFFQDDGFLELQVFVVVEAEHEEVATSI